MGVVLTIEEPLVTAAPGATASVPVTILNTGTVVDQFSLTVLGDAAAFSTVEPPTISLMPGDTGRAHLVVRLPTGPQPEAGPLPYGVMAAAQQDPEHSVVEGTIEVLPVDGLTAQLVPTTASGRRSRHVVLITNTGNRHMRFCVAATDPDDLLELALHADAIEIPSGAMAEVEVKVRSLGLGDRGREAFTVTVSPDAGDAVALGGALVATRRRRLLLPIAVAVITLGVVAAVVLTKRDSPTSGLNLASSSASTTPGDPTKADPAANGDAKAKVDDKVVPLAVDPTVDTKVKPPVIPVPGSTTTTKGTTKPPPTGLLVPITTSTTHGPVTAAGSDTGVIGDNLVANDSAEEGARSADSNGKVVPPRWTVAAGSPTQVAYDTAGGFPTSAAQQPKDCCGQAFFAGGPGGTSRLSQDVRLDGFAKLIDSGHGEVDFGAWLGGYLGTADRASMTVQLLSATGGVLATGPILTVDAAGRGNATALVEKGDGLAAPKGARTARVILDFLRNDPNGPYCDGYVDNVFVQVARV